MQQPQLLERVVRISRDVVSQVDPAMHALPTPCSAWNVRQLVNHMAITCRYAAAVMEGTPPSENRLADDDVLGDDIARGYGTAAARVVAAFTERGALDRIVSAPAGQVPGSVWVPFPTWDIYVHTWDLATATGIEMEQPAEVTETVLAWGTETFTGSRQVDQIGELLEIGVDASAMDRLIGFFGRTPAA